MAVLRGGHFVFGDFSRRIIETIIRKVIGSK